MSDTTINNGGVGNPSPVSTAIVWDEEGYLDAGEVRVGPIDTPFGVGYVYRIGDRLSEVYSTSASARYDSTRGQFVNSRGRLRPTNL